MSDFRQKVYGDLVVVQPALEPWPEVMRKVGPFAVFLYCRWSCFAVGFDILEAGLALHVGPVMIGFCHIRKQTAAFVEKDKAP